MDDVILFLAEKNKTVQQKRKERGLDNPPDYKDSSDSSADDSSPDDSSPDDSSAQASSPNHSSPKDIAEFVESAR